MGGDDLAAFYDVITTGQRLVYEPSAIVVHRHYREYAGLRRQTYGYGAGLGAYLTRCVLRDPRAALTLLRHAPATTRRGRRILTPPAVAGLPPYPRDLTLQQWRGLMSGPWRYLRSRHHARQQDVPSAERRVARGQILPGRPSEAPPSVVISLASRWRARVRAQGVRGAGPLEGRSRRDPKVPSAREVRSP
jgi:hypothetical protein